MYEQVRNAYHAVAKEFDLKILPSGDAMYLADTDSKWGFKPDSNFDSKKTGYPDVPKQQHSLHTGWFWKKSPKSGEKILRMDGHHASKAGCFLIGCTWYKVFFGDSAIENSYVPEEIELAYAKFLKGVAHRAVNRLKDLQ